VKFNYYRTFRKVEARCRSVVGRFSAHRVDSAVATHIDRRASERIPCAASLADSKKQNENEKTPNENKCELAENYRNATTVLHEAGAAAGEFCPTDRPVAWFADEITSDR